MSKTLKAMTLHLSAKTKRFTDIKRLNPIPTDYIIDKTEPGLGATYAEIIAERNSILILPNVATILSKIEHHKDDTNPPFAVYENVTQKELAAYLKTDQTYKTILTTPEGFIKKVKPVLGNKMHSSYFLLLDECHKYVTDSGYRKEIMLPMDDFFIFANKAMVTSTLLIPSDPRFIEHGFKLIKLKPFKETKHPLLLIKTPSVIQSLLTYIRNNPSQYYFIFFNSIQGITSTIESMKALLGEDEMQGQYRIFCSKESSKELKLKGYADSYNSFIPDAKYNFLTSSFFNGMDITYTSKRAHVIILSDVRYALHSALQPSIDTVQIRGRFRPYECEGKLVDWVDNTVHIVRTYRKIIHLTREQAIEKVQASRQLYEHINNYNLTTQIPAIQDNIKHILSRVSPYANLLDSNGLVDPFKMDNYMYQEEVKAHYVSLESIIKAYQQPDRFILTYEQHRYIKNLEKLKHSNGKYSPENYRDVTDILWHSEGLHEDYWYQHQIRYLYQHFELIVRAYNTLGIHLMVKLSFDHNLIKRALTYAEGLEGLNKFPVIDAIQHEFHTDRVYLLSEVKDMLQEVFDQYEVPITADASDVKMYFDVEECQKKRQRAYRVLRLSKNSFYARV